MHTSATGVVRSAWSKYGCGTDRLKRSQNATHQASAISGPSTSQLLLRRLRHRSISTRAPCGGIS